MSRQGTCWTWFLALSAMAAVGSCGFQDQNSVWYDQLEPGGPCHAVNLADGLSEENTQELHDTFNCLNQNGNLDPLIELDQVMDISTRASEPAGVELAVVLNALSTADIDPFGIAGDLLAWMENPDGRETVDTFLETLVELIYGEPYAIVSAEDFTLNSTEALDKGLLRPLLPAIRAGAAATLDDELRVLELAQAALESETTLALLHTLAAWGEEPSFEGVFDDLPRKLGVAIDASRSPANDRWEDASGDSLRDLLEALLVDKEEDGRIVFAHLDDHLFDLLNNDRVRDELEVVLGSLQAEGALANFPVELLYFTAVDAEGGTLSTGEDSALVTLMRLLRRGDQPMECTLSLLGIWDIEVIEVENLSEEMLKLFADMDPNAAVDAVDLVGGALDLEILGFELTDYILGLIADFGLCTNPATGSVVLDESYVTDLESLDRFNDAQAGETLRTMVHLLAAIHDTSTSEIPALVGLLSNADDHGLTEPAEEALRDLGDAALLSDVVNLLPGLLEPDDYSDDHDYPDGVEPVDFAAVWDILRASATLSTDDRTPVEDLAEPIAAAAGQAETWEAIGNLAVMLQDPSQHLHTRGSGLDQLLELDPELALIRAVGGVMLSPDAGGALLRIAEQQEVIDALGRASGEGEEQEGPLPFTAHLITHGTVEALLDVLDRILGSL